MKLKRDEDKLASVTTARLLAAPETEVFSKKSKQKQKLKTMPITKDATNCLACSDLDPILFYLTSGQVFSVASGKSAK